MRHRDDSLCRDYGLLERGVPLSTNVALSIFNIEEISDAVKSILKIRKLAWHFVIEVMGAGSELGGL